MYTYDPPPSLFVQVTVVFTMFYWGDWRVTLLVLGCFPIMGAAMGIAMAAMMPMDQGKQGKQVQLAKRWP